jgi:hypothetical protein
MLMKALMHTLWLHVAMTTMCVVVYNIGTYTVPYHIDSLAGAKPSSGLWVQMNPPKNEKSVLTVTYWPFMHPPGPNNLHPPQPNFTSPTAYNVANLQPN